MLMPLFLHLCSASIITIVMINCTDNVMLIQIYFVFIRLATKISGTLKIENWGILGTLCTFNEPIFQYQNSYCIQTQ